MQKMLTSLMTKVGAAVEKVASAVSKPKTAKPKKTGVTDAEGQDFGFIQWNERQLHSLLAGAERKEIVPLFPALNGKKCLHLSPGGENYLETLAWRSDLPALIPEASRCLKDSGRVLLTTIHPFFEYLMNPRIGFKKHIDTLFGTLKKHSFFTEELKEGSIDDVVKSVSLP